MPECVFYESSRPCHHFRRPVFYGTKVKVEKIWTPTPTARAFDLALHERLSLCWQQGQRSVQPNTSSGVVPATPKWELICLFAFDWYLASYVSSRLALLSAAYLVPTTNQYSVASDAPLRLLIYPTNNVCLADLIRAEQNKSVVQCSAKPRHITSIATS